MRSILRYAPFALDRILTMLEAWMSCTAAAESGNKLLMDRELYEECQSAGEADRMI